MQARKLVIVVLLVALGVSAQTVNRINGNGSAGVSYIGPISGLPGSCTIGEIAIATDASPNIYISTSSPCVWTQQTVTPSQIGAVPTTTTVNGHALSSNVTVTASDVSLGSVTNDAQTKNSIVPNTFSGVRFGNGGTIDTAATSAQLQTVVGAGVYDASGAAAARAAVQTCTNKALAAVDTAGTSTNCVTITSAYTDTSIAHTGTDINTSDQVTATHLASPLPALQGGLGVSGAGLTGFVREAAGTVTAGEFTGDVANTGLATTVNKVLNVQAFLPKMTTAAMTQQTSATCTNITNMTWTIAASKNYVMQCEVPVTFVASATLQFCLGGPGTATSYSLEQMGPIGASAAFSDTGTFAQTAYGTKTTASGAPGATTAMVHVRAGIQNGSTASGTALTLQTAANGTNGITVGANATCTLEQVN